MKLRMKEHAVDVLQVKIEGLEGEIKRKDERMQEMRVKERMYEEVEGKMRKREEMLRAKSAECEKIRGIVDKKDVEIGRLKKDVRILSEKPESPGGRFLKLKNDKERLEGENKGHVRELKILRSIARGKVKEVAKEGGGGTGECDREAQGHGGGDGEGQEDNPGG